MNRPSLPTIAAALTATTVIVLLADNWFHPALFTAATIRTLTALTITILAFYLFSTPHDSQL